MFLGFSPSSCLPGWNWSDLAFLGKVGGACAEKAKWNMPITNICHKVEGHLIILKGVIVFLLNMLLNF